MEDPLAPPPERVSLAKIAVALVVVIILAFGLCARNLNLEGPSSVIVNIAVAVEVICVFGLFVLIAIHFNRR